MDTQTDPVVQILVLAFRRGLAIRKSQPEQIARNNHTKCTIPPTQGTPEGDGKAAQTGKKGEQ